MAMGISLHHVPKIALDKFRKHNVVTLGLQMPVLCYGSEPLVSNRVYALTSVVLPVHSRGSSVGIPSAWEEKSPLKSTVFA